MEFLVQKWQRNIEDIESRKFAGIMHSVRGEIKMKHIQGYSWYRFPPRRRGMRQPSSSWNQSSPLLLSLSFLPCQGAIYAHKQDKIAIPCEIRIDAGTLEDMPARELAVSPTTNSKALKPELADDLRKRLLDCCSHIVVSSLDSPDSFSWLRFSALVGLLGAHSLLIIKTIPPR